MWHPTANVYENIEFSSLLSPGPKTF